MLEIANDTDSGIDGGFVGSAQHMTQLATIAMWRCRKCHGLCIEARSRARGEAVKAQPSAKSDALAQVSGARLRVDPANL